MKKIALGPCISVLTGIAVAFFTAQASLAQGHRIPNIYPSPADSVKARVDELFAQWDKSASPGCALGVVKEGRLIYKRGYGMADLAYDIPLSSKSVFRMASISKQFTAMSILLLAKQGKLSLNDDIEEYLPELPRYESRITIQHLIHHTSGIRNFVQLTELAGMLGENVHLTDDDVLGLIALQKELNFKPGTEYLYSNSGYFLLGLIVRRVTGKSLSKFAHENIFSPLGMSSTHFHDDRSLVVKNRVTAYPPRRSGGFAVAIPSNAAVVGAGGLYSSVDDLFLWDQNFYTNKLGGGPELISEQISSGKLNNGEKTGYAFGLKVGAYQGLKMIHHAGSSGGFEHETIRFPEHKLSVICLCNAGNRMSAYDLATQVADIFLEDRLKTRTSGVNGITAAVPPIINISEGELAELTGLYVDPITVRSLSFYMKHGKLMIAWGGEPDPLPVTADHVLSPVGKNRFRTGRGGNVEIVFMQPAAGGRKQVKATSSGRSTTLEAVQPLTSAQLADFTGDYLSDELPGATYTFSVKDGKLLLRVRNKFTVFSNRDLPLAFELPSGSEPPKAQLFIPALSDVFFTFVDEELVVLRFSRNQRNAVSGFRLNTQTVRRLRFDKS